MKEYFICFSDNFDFEIAISKLPKDIKIIEKQPVYNVVYCIIEDESKIKQLKQENYIINIDYNYSII